MKPEPDAISASSATSATSEAGGPASPQSTKAAGTGRAPAGVEAAVFAPLLLHGAATAYVWIARPRFTFETADAVALALAVLYALSALWALARRERAVRFALAAGSCLLALGTIELLLWTAVPQDDRLLPRIPMRRVSEAGDAMPGIQGKIEYSINSLGLRGPEVALDEVDHRILCVGGSTTECFYVTDRKTWPWLLQEELERALARKVFVGNSGKPGHFTINHEYLLRNYMYAKRFEWVVVLCGINELGRLLMNDLEARIEQVPKRTLVSARPPRRYNPNRPYYRNLLVVERVRTAIERLRGPELAEGEVLQDERGDVYEDDRRERQRGLAENTIEEIPSGLPEALATYRSHLRRVIQAGRDNGQRMLFLTQPTMYRADLPPELDRLMWAGQRLQDGAFSAGALAEMMDAFNAVLIEVCREEEVDCIDLAALLPKDTRAFYDDCHFNIEGCERVAAILAPYFREKLGARAQAGE